MLKKEKLKKTKSSMIKSLISSSFLKLLFILVISNSFVTKMRLPVALRESVKLKKDYFAVKNIAGNFLKTE